MISKIFNFKFLILISFSGIVFLTTSVFAADNNVLSIELGITKDNKVTLENMAVQDGVGPLEAGGQGSYEFLLTGGLFNSKLYSYKFDVRFNFCSYSQDCFDLEKSGVEIQAPNLSNVTKMVVKKSGKVIFSQTIQKLLCNNDNLCNNYENYLSCSTDCSPAAKDDFCNSRYKDGICDLDCSFDTDLGGDCGGSYVAAQVFYGASEKDLNFVCAADKKIYGSVTTANTQNFLFSGLAQVLNSWRRGLGALLAQVASGGNCSVNAPWKVNYQGVNDKVGFTNQTSDGRFLCSQSKFYECGWESTIPDFAVEASQNQKVGNWSCDLQNRKWNAVLVIPPVSTNDCSAIAPWKTEYRGVNDQLGFTNQTTDNRFLCSQSKFYECGWESTIPEFAIEANQNQQVGSRYCDLKVRAWKSGAAPVSVGTQDCKWVNAGLTVTGTHNQTTIYTNGYPSTDGRNLCYNTKIYECDNDGVSHSFSINAIAGQQVGNLICEQNNRRWVLRSCIEKDWTFTVTPLVCPSTSKQIKTWTKTGECSLGVQHPASESIGCAYISPIPPTLPKPPVPPTIPAQGEKFVVGTYPFDGKSDRIFIVSITDPITIKQARDCYVYSQQNSKDPRCGKHISGSIASGNGGFNTNWNWHLIPETVRMAEASIELCDGVPNDVERLGVRFGVGSFCPWNSYILNLGDQYPTLPPIPPVTEKCSSGCVLPKWITASEGVFSDIDRNQECVEVGEKFSAKPNTAINIPESKAGDYILGIDSSSSGFKASFSPAGGEKYELFNGKTYDITQSGWDGKIKLKVDGIKPE